MADIPCYAFLILLELTSTPVLLCDFSCAFGLIYKLATMCRLRILLHIAVLLTTVSFHMIVPFFMNLKLCHLSFKVLFPPVSFVSAYL